MWKANGGNQLAKKYHKGEALCKLRLSIRSWSSGSQNLSYGRKGPCAGNTRLEYTQLSYPAFVETN